jgi:D-alanyl-D-alanine carboxypeptidase
VRHAFQVPDAMPVRSAARRLGALACLLLGLLPGALAGPAATLAAGPSGSAAATPAPLPACRYDDLTAPAAGYDEWQLTLLDTIYRLPPGYVPPELVSISDLGTVPTLQVRSFVADDLRQMADAARQAGVPFVVFSAYRSEERQVQVLASLVGSLGTDAALDLSARPGHSEHQLGTTVDLTDPPGTPEWEGDWGESPAGRWLAANAWQYGFIMSYPREVSPAITCYEYEPWHFRYFGRAEAAAIHDSGLAPRAYLWLHLPPAETRAPEAAGDNGWVSLAAALAGAALLLAAGLALGARLRARPRRRPARSGE